MERCLPVAVLFTLAVSLAPSQQVDGASLMNGDFSIPGVAGAPFADWSTSTGAPDNYLSPTDGGGFAVFTSDASASEIQLFQDFTIPTSVTGLSFQFKIASTLPIVSSGYVPASFQASLYDASDTPFAPADPNLGPSFYSIDIASPIQNYYDPTFVSVTAPSADGWRTVSLFSLSGLSLPQDVRLEFFLSASSDAGETTFVYLDNVQTLGVTPAVPEPSTLLLGVLGTPLLAAYGWRRGTHLSSSTRTFTDSWQMGSIVG